MAAVTVGAVATLGAGYMASRAGKKGAKAQEQASQAAIAEERRQFDLTRGDMAPFLGAGTQALSRLEALNAGDYSGFESSPDYLWARDQGLQGVDRSAAARGALYSGGADADRIRFASGLASQNLGNYTNRLMGLAGAGQSAATNLGAFGQNMAGSIGQQLNQQGQARASSYATSANAWGNAMQEGASGFSDWWGQRQGRQG